MTEMSKKFQIRSLLMEIPPEVFAKIDLLAKESVKISSKQQKCMEIFNEYNISVMELGSGSNRCAFKYKGKVLKIALDKLGKENNLKEFKYSEVLYPAVVKVYECDPQGLIIVCEYVSLYSSHNVLLAHKAKVKEVLEHLTSQFYIADIGLTSINFNNWGYRNNDMDQPTCLDFAYLFPIGLESFKCVKCGGVISYDNNFNNLQCKKCHAEISFGEMVRMMSKEDIAKGSDYSDFTNYVLVFDTIQTKEIERDKWPKKNTDEKRKKKLDFFELAKRSRFKFYKIA